MFGELMATDAANQRLAGLVLQGPVRDIADIDELGFPVWCTGTAPGQAAKATVVSVGLPVVVGGVLVASGDQVIADRDGMAVVPAAEWPAIEAEVAALAAKEEKTRARLAAGGRLADINGLDLARFVAGRATHKSKLDNQRKTFNRHPRQFAGIVERGRAGALRPPQPPRRSHGARSSRRISAGARGSSRTRRWATTRPTTCRPTPTCWPRSGSPRSPACHRRRPAPRWRGSPPPPPGPWCGPTGSPPMTTTRPSATGWTRCPAARASTSPTSPTTSTCSRKARSRT